jgi:pyruvate dehydrogenase E1 component alpha subunit
MAPRKTQKTANPLLVLPLALSLAGDASPSNPDVLRTLYTALLKTRLLEEQIFSLLRAGRISATALPTLGGEATEVGACIGLESDDSFSSPRPQLATDVVRGTPLERIFAQLLSQDKEASKTSTQHPSPSFRVLPQTSSVIGQLEVATGVALAYRNLGKPNVVVTLADDGLAALGFWHEAASLASRNRLPLIVIVENPQHPHTLGNGMIHSDEDLRDRAEAYGFPGITVDGNDIVAVWRVTQESIHRARTGAGPTLIECRTRRWHAGVGPSNGHTRLNRATDSQPDPLLHMEHYMKKRSLWKQIWKDDLVADYRGLLRGAVESIATYN